jgi:hypothetical protein
MLARREQDLARVRRVESLRHCPRQGLAREVVDYRPKVDCGAIDQLDDTGIDMPISFGLEARTPRAGLWGWTRGRGRRQPCSRTSFAWVDWGGRGVPRRI